MAHDSQKSASNKTAASSEAFEETGNAAAEPKTKPTPNSTKIKAFKTKVPSLATKLEEPKSDDRKLRRAVCYGTESGVGLLL
jgi:hypothetical protein